MRTTVNQTMNQTFRRLVLASAVGAAALLAGCASTKRNPGNSTFDFGPRRASRRPPASAAVGALVVTDVTGAPALDSERMYYRLNYADPLQARSYASSRWAGTPLQHGHPAHQVAPGAVRRQGADRPPTPPPACRSCAWRSTTSPTPSTAPPQSYGQLVLRASLFHGHKLVDQRTFNRKAGAASADAAGGARALAASHRRRAADMIAWLATLQLPKQ